MPKPKTRKYLVIVQEGPPAVPGFSGITYSLGQRTTVRTVDATSERDAADKVTVPAGATAYVAAQDYVCKFKRPTVAALEAA